MRFDAFISYSHAADGKLAPAIERGLKRFAKPLFRLRALEVFRDNASLAANPGLWSSIESSLDVSAHLLLMASPDAAGSPWVTREVEHWLRTKPATALLIVLTEGDIAWDPEQSDFDWQRTDALPAILGRQFAEEPRWIDFRWARSETDLSLANPRFHSAIADLAAPLHGRRKDELIGEDVSQHRRLRLITRSGIAALVSLVIGLGVSLVYAVGQREEAQAQASLAEERRRLAEQQRDDALRTQSLFLADLSGQRVREGDAVTAARLALRALPRNGDRPYVAQAESALRMAMLYQREIAVLDERARPTDSAYSVTFSHDGTILAGAVEDRIVLADAATRTPIATLEGHDNHINQVAFSPDDRLLVSVSHDHTLRLWERKTGAVRAILEGHESAVWCVAFSPDGRHLASGSADGTVRVWSVADGALAMILEGHGGWVRSVAYAPDGTRILSAANDGTVRLWDAMTGSPLRTIEASEQQVLSVAFSQGGAVIASAGADNAIRFWDPATGEPRGTLTGHDAGVGALAFRSDDRQLISGAFDGTVRIWDLQTGRHSATLRGHDGWVSAVTYAPGERQILSASFDGTVRVWDARWGPNLLTLEGHEGPVYNTAFSPDDRLLASAGADGTLRIWDLSSERPVQIVDGHDARIRAVAWAPDGGRLASGSADGTVRLWDAETGRNLLVLPGHDGGITDVAFSDEGDRLLSVARKAARVQVWDPADGSLLHTFTADESAEALTARFSPDGTRIIAVFADGTVRRWDLASASSLPIVQVASAEIDHAALSPDGRHVVTAASINLRLFDTSTGAQLAEGRLDAPSNGLRFAPDGGRIVEASAMGTARLFAAADLRWRLRLPWGPIHAEKIAAGIPGLVEPLLSATLSHNGNRVAFSPYDGTVRVWFAGRDLEQLIRQADKVLPRCLTIEQEKTYFLREASDERPLDPDHCRSPDPGPAG